MTKLYRAVDKMDNTLSCFMVNDKGVAISEHCGNDEKEIYMNKNAEQRVLYDNFKDFEERAINPVLIAEW